MASYSTRPAVTTTDLTKYYKRIAEGKVRDLYEIDEKTLLFVATDRISAYDVILENGVPGKGALLTTLSAYWFSVLPPLVPGLKTHFITLDLPSKIMKDLEVAKNYEGRSMQVRKLEVLPIESIVRGYITGSAWSEYKKSETVHGMDVGAGLRESEAFPEPIWTPSTKAEQGEHDENISPAKGKVFTNSMLLGNNNGVF
jgi:phosphoribosylaminoimidazole-succinocarboxamide synthase